MHSHSIGWTGEAPGRAVCLYLDAEPLALGVAPIERRAGGQATPLGHCYSFTALLWPLPHSRRRTYLSVSFQDFSCSGRFPFFALCRYVERNRVRPNLVMRAEDWQYGSLYRWNQRVNEPLSETELFAIRTSVNRGRPYGDEQWTEEVAEKHGIWFTLRPVGRPQNNRILGQ